MRILLNKGSFHYGVAGLLVAAAVLLLIKVVHTPDTERILTTVDIGTVHDFVSVSGYVEAENTAQLAFTITGIVADVLVREGDTVAAGDTLITLTRAALLAERAEALANLTYTEADRDELIAGPSAEARTVTETEVTIAADNLTQTTRTETEKVANARQTLLSSGLTAQAVNGDEEATAPTISGSYTCDQEGTYVLELYRSNTKSGYSYRYSGIETGTDTVYTEQAATLGTCGLFIVFDAGSRYANSTWEIAIPNTNSTSYVANRNAYELAQTNAEHAIADAAQAYQLAKNQARVTNADPRTESLVRANAQVSQMQARLNRIDAELADRTLIAPFDGIITNVDVLAGETVTTAPVITLLADSAFEVTARIPEIDIAKVHSGQTAEIYFDANTNEALQATIRFISPNATEIDGVAYFEAKLVLDNPPSWLRSGLNADVDIITAAATDVLRVPKRFITTDTAGNSTVLVQTDPDLPLVETPITISFTGNDGYVAIAGVAAHTIIAAP